MFIIDYAISHPFRMVAAIFILSTVLLLIAMVTADKDPNDDQNLGI